MLEPGIEPQAEEGAPGTVAIAGAGGYVGRRLTERLTSRGYTVLALGRDASRLPSGERIIPRSVDVGEAPAITEALSGARAAYYLVHAMAGGRGFADRDRELARTFGAAAAAAGVERITYVGGLGGDDLSEHLASRQEVGSILSESGVPVVELRAAVILGAGSISFEMLRYLTERLPIMVCPRWVGTRVQPLAERDLLTYLEQSLEAPPGVYEVGGPDVTTYGDMMKTYARVRGLRPRRIVKLPLLTPSLSAHWVDLVTPVDVAVSHALIESLTADVTVRSPEATAAAFSVQPLGLEQAMQAALDEQAARIPPALLELADGEQDGVFAMRASTPLPPSLAEAARRDLDQCGGDLDWYGLAFAWRLRIAAGWLFGERLTLSRPAALVPGAQADWWTVEIRDQDCLVLGTTAWFFGEAWLGYRLNDPPAATAEQVGALRPKGVPGLVYWRVLWPVHRRVFNQMARHRALRRQKIRWPWMARARAGANLLPE